MFTLQLALNIAVQSSLPILVLGAPRAGRSWILAVLASQFSRRYRQRLLTVLIEQYKTQQLFRMSKQPAVRQAVAQLRSNTRNSQKTGFPIGWCHLLPGFAYNYCHRYKGRFCRIATLRLPKFC